MTCSLDSLGCVWWEFIGFCCKVSVIGGFAAEAVADYYIPDKD